MPDLESLGAGWDRVPAASLFGVWPIETLRALAGLPRHRPARLVWTGASDARAAAASASEPYWARGKAELDALVLLVDIPRLEPRNAR